MKQCLWNLVLSIFLATMVWPVHADTLTADVVVYGGTAGGAMAAIAAAKEGADVVLVEPKGHIGGMVTGGLGATDFGKKMVIGGMAREFFCPDGPALRRGRRLVF